MTGAVDPPGKPTPLEHIIRERIASAGPMSVHDYMALCLSHPEHGYYRQRLAIGRAGDFITAPEISQIFGEIIGLWSAVALRMLAVKGPMALIEIGPGRGTLMTDALRALATVPDLRGRIEVHLVEPSPALAALQRQTLAGALVAPTWHSALGTVPPGPAVILANEVVDALPVRQLVVRRGRWHERQVGLAADGRLVFTEAPEPSAAAPAVAEGSLTELRPEADALIGAIAARATRYPTAGLLIDYGHLRSGHGDTLQAVRHNRAADPLVGAGDSDLSAQVDFEALAVSARRHGLEVDGPVPQAVFLGGLGLVERAQRLMDSADARHAAAIEAGALRLIAPSGMGSRFKTIGLRSAGVGRLPGL